MIARSVRALVGPVGLVGLVALAAVLRLPDLATRGTWDGDQGHDMLVLRALVQDGTLPLLGPPTSIGDFHHGALYYYLLAPAAAVTGGESPLAVVTLIALLGIAAVGVTWWLARSMGGPVAGLVAGLLMAVSISAIDESTFIWNPNPIPLASALALAGAWRAWSTGRVRWWLVAAGATAVTMQLHVLGIAFLPIIGALFVADVWRRRRGGARDLRLVAVAAVAGVAIIAFSYLPLVASELTTDFSETRAALDYLAGGREPSDLDPATRTVIVGVRVITWPLVGLVTDAGIVALVAALGVVLVAVWPARRPACPERTAARWLGLGLAWATVALSFGASSLATVVRGLPNDHYHAFADPMVFALVGVGAGAAWRRGRAGLGEVGLGGAGPGVAGAGGGPGVGGAGVGGAGAAQRVGWVVPVGAVVVVVVVAALVAWNVMRLPPGIHPDGGFPAAAAAAERIGTVVGNRPTALRSIPDFKSTEAYRYPLVLDDRRLVEEGDAGALVVICDSLFEAVVGAACGGPAEAAAVDPSGRFPNLADRFEAAPGRTISVYLAAG